MSIPYYHVDSFTAGLFAGNPAGVCILPAYASDEVMQKIAAENRQSQTAFVVARADGDFDLRWFTPEVEDDLCGHATLAAAHVLALRGQQAWPVRFHTRSGVLSVVRDGDWYEMDFPIWPAQACEAPPELLLGLGVSSADVSKARDYLVVLGSVDEVRNLLPDFAALGRLDIGIGGVIVTAPGDGTVDYVARFLPRPWVSPKTPSRGRFNARSPITGLPAWEAGRSRYAT